MKSVNGLFLSLLVFFGSFAGLPDGTRVLINEESVRCVESLSVGDEILSCLDDYNNTDVQVRHIKDIKKSYTYELISIVTKDDGVFVVSPDQLVFCVEREDYVPAATLVPGECVINSFFEQVEIKCVESIPLESWVTLNFLEVEENSNLFICDNNGNTILIHNGLVFVPFVIFTIPKIVTAVKVGFVAVSAGCALAETAISFYKSSKKKKRVERSLNSGDKFEITKDSIVFHDTLEKMAQREGWEKLPANAVKRGDFPYVIPDAVWSKLGQTAFRITDPAQVQAKLKEVIKKYGGGSGNGPEDPNSLFEKFLDLVKSPDALLHIFRKAEGHLDETERSVKGILRFLEIVKPENMVTQCGAEHGFKTIFKKLVSEGELWVEMVNGKLNNAGINRLSK